jgi:hypothetical protein
MVRIGHTGFATRCIRFSVAAMALALLGALSVTPAAAQCTVSGSNTFCGTNAGAGATAIDDSGFGFDVFSSGESGGLNSAFGWEALQNNTTGTENVATGPSALNLNTTGSYNVATGSAALLNNTTGRNNTAVGEVAMESNISGTRNTATGDAALGFNTTGDNNVAVGNVALFNNTTGSNNIGVGRNAGSNLTTGDNNIDIGALGVAGESNFIRIGRKGVQTAAVIQGIYSSTLTSDSPVPVMVNSNGRLGVAPSSARFKRDVRNLGDASSGLMKLRPVSFRYKDDPDSALQYGLIAEEVAPVYPELVVRGDDGRINGVRYDLLPALLINEVQKLAKENRRLVAQVAALKKKDAQVDALAERMNALERQVRSTRQEHLASATR